MADVSKEFKKEEQKIENAFKNSKINVWMIVSVILVAALIAAIAWPSGNLSKAEAGEVTLNFINGNLVQDGGVTLNNVTDKGSLYEVKVAYQGKEIPVYLTKDGKYFIQMPTEIASATGNAIDDSSASETPQEVPKSDKPKVEAFIFSYCPYGLQFEKALAPVYNLLKNKADLNIVAIGAMHGEYEKIESLRQLCVKKEYGNDKLWKYLEAFAANTAIGSCSGSDACLSPLLSSMMNSLSIDKAKIDACMAKDGEALYAADTALAASLGVSGSPTFMINGVETSVSRSPDAILKAVCGAFTESSKPSECSQALSTSQEAPGFGSSASGSASSASCG